MRRARAVALATWVLVVVATTVLGVPAAGVSAATVSDAAAACTPSDEPPKVLEVSAQDVAIRPGGSSAHQAVHVLVENTCGGMSSYDCAFSETSCTGLNMFLHRTTAAGAAGRGCGISPSWADDATGGQPAP